MHVFELTRRLIDIPSISGAEKALAEFLADYLSRAGFAVELQEAEANRPNLYAWHGTPEVVLSSHTDTVPPYVEFHEDEQTIYGRGACDAKGIIAAMVKAAERLLAANQSDFGLLFVVGEEAGSAGARAANQIPNRSRYLINGEPTESKLALGSKGALRAALRATGRAAHSAYPHMGESAIDKLLDVLADLRRLELPNDPQLGATTLNIGLIKGGVATNVIAPEAEAELLFRIVTDAATVRRLFEATVNGRAAIDYSFACDAVFMEALEGFDTEVVAFTTDIPLLGGWGKPLLFGPGSILDAHTAHERISKLELLRAVDVYAEMVTTLKAKIADGAQSD
ncbi:MAG TPA: M20/M25/M40 family metallo-hydrolase [Blastocatellia bacterium]|nr:M20/M25/M40 family metallo-hydrolase [Blastocatellia bacterium]